MNDFDYDVLQKKRVASGARHVKRGSRSQKCSLPHDHMTQKQWKELNGDVETFSMTKPVTWQKFRSMSTDIQTEYIKGLVDRFSVTQGELADMMGVSRNTFRNYLNVYVPTVKFSRGARMSAENQEAFLQFLTEDGVVIPEKKELKKSIAQEVVVEPEPELKEEVHNAPDEVGGFSMSEFTLKFFGIPNIETLFNSLQYMLPKDEEVEIEIVMRKKH